MITKVRFIKKYQNRIIGEIAELSNNDAHALIDGGYAKLYNEYENKMMTTKRTKNVNKLRKS